MTGTETLKMEFAPAFVKKTATALTPDQKEYVEVSFFQVWGADDGRDIYDFVAQEAEAFVRENPGFAALKGLVEKEFLRLARAER